MIDDTLRSVSNVTRDLFEDPRGLEVESRGTAGEIRRHLSRYDFASPISEDALIADVAAMLRRWGVHVTHPRYFGLFNPSVRPISVAADALAAAFNPQLATWSHASAANEIERHVLQLFLERIGFDPERSSAAFTTGGQEANMCATLAALTHVYPETERKGVRSLPGDPTIYLSAQGHHSFQKIAHAAGLGRDALRSVPVDQRLRMNVSACAAMIAADRQAGKAPLMIVATAGTTGAGAIDPLAELADLSARERVWLHVDAAWGGSALLSSALRPVLAGIERADSVTWDAHKWLSVPVGAGMFFCRWPDAVLRTFHVSGANYVPPSASDSLDPYLSTIQWSRRFIGLKVFMALAETGMAHFADAIDHQVRIANCLRDTLVRSNWQAVNDSPLAIVCFTHPAIRDGRRTARAVVDAVNGTGRAWVSELTLPDSGSVIRACVTSYLTEEEDIDVLVKELDRAIAT